MPSDAGQTFGDSYIALFDNGAPSPNSLAELKTSLPSTLGSSVAIARADSLIDNAPALFAAVGSSQAKIATIVTDVQANADAGGGTLLNQFRVHIVA